VKNADLSIVIRAWSVPEQTGYQFDAKEIITALRSRVKNGGDGLVVSIVGGKLK
jgi:hypothetical protein